MELVLFVALAAVLVLRARSEARSRRRLEEQIRELTERVFQLEHARGAALGPLTDAAPEPVAPRYDPATGRPLTDPSPGAAPLEPVAPRYDPATGRPLTGPAPSAAPWEPVAPSCDPATGWPLADPSLSAAPLEPDVRCYDPATGWPLRDPSPSAAPLEPDVRCYDPATGRPLTDPAPGATPLEPVAPRYDPVTGRPLQPGSPFDGPGAGAPAPPTPPGESLRNRLRGLIGNDEWEALVGGSILNKLGAVILVVGLILFLGYSFARMGAGGRVAVSLGLSGALLAAGVLVERRQLYRVFSWGLIGAGWASLYATSYAMYALDAARVIENPTLGASLQAAVATAMIAHSLRYRRQTVTAIAAASAFAALAAAPSPQFGAAGLLPLSAALLYLAQRLRWHAVGLFSLIASYAIVVARGDPASPLAYTQAFLLALWLIFEAFDLLQLSDPRPAPAYAAALFPLNALAFLALSAMKWDAAAPGYLYQFLAAASLLYLGDAILRGNLRQGAYRDSIVLASALAALAVIREAGGAWAATLLAVEAELLLMAALRWRLRFLEWLAGAAFCCALLRLAFAAGGPDSLAFAGLTLHDWTPAAFGLAVLAYVNRHYRTVAMPYGYFGAALVHLILGAETPARWLALVWFAWAAVLLELSLRRKAAEFRRQSYTAWAFGCVAMLATHLDSLTRNPPVAAWASLAGAAAMGLAGSWRLWRAAHCRVASTASAAAATLFALALAGRLLPANRLALGWTAVALLWIECGYRWSHRPLRWLGHAAAALVVLPLALAQILTSTFLPVSAACLWLWRRCPDLAWTRLYGSAATLLVSILLHHQLSAAYAVASWAALGLVLLITGTRTGIPDLRWQSYALAAATAIRCLLWDPADPYRAAACGAAAALLYAQQFLAPRAAGCFRWERWARPGYSALATLTVATLLYRESSGSVLTVAWGVQGLLLLAAGFPLRERILRLSGLALLLVCIGKLFFYDLRNLDTLPRIVSFLVLGVILIAVSWSYTRFRQRLRQLVGTSAEERESHSGQQAGHQQE